MVVIWSICYVYSNLSKSNIDKSERPYSLGCHWILFLINQTHINAYKNNDGGYDGIDNIIIIDSLPIQYYTILYCNSE